MVKKQTSCQIKCLRTDNGLEFCAEEFNNFCKEHGILRHRTVRYTPQQNGVNKTILERVRSLLSDAILPEKFWAEATSYIVYTLNRCPHASLNFLTPEEKWSKHPPNLNNGFVHHNKGKLNA